MAGRVVFLSLASAVIAVNPRLINLSSPRDVTSVFASVVPKSTAQCPEVNPRGGSLPFQSYYDGQIGGCPVVNALDNDGSCSSHMASAGAAAACSAYCEIRNYFSYGQEVPYPDISSCNAGDECSITATHSVSISQTFGFDITGAANLGKRDNIEDLLFAREDAAEIETILTSAFNLGASYQYSIATTKSTAEAQTRPAATGKDCGYWTAVPVFMTSCGTLTTAPVADIAVREPYCDVTKKLTTPNWCNTTPYLNSDGSQLTVTLFVATDCNTNALLPASQQAAIYNYPGVSSTNHPPAQVSSCPAQVSSGSVC